MFQTYFIFKNSSPMDLIYPEIDMDKLGNRVQWTRFPCIETELIKLGLYTQKSSSMNSISMSHPHSIFVQTRTPCMK